MSPFSHKLALLSASALSLLLLFHKAPGFTPYLSLDFDLPFIGLFPLALNLPLIVDARGAKEMLRIALPLTLLALLLLFGPALYMGLLPPVFHLEPASLPLLFVRALFFIAIPYEVFFRGFLQKELTLLIPHRTGGALALLLTSILFTLCHSGAPVSLFLLFLSSLFYGLIFLLSGRIEGPILCHFLVTLMSSGFTP